MLYWVLKWVVLGPWLRLLFRPVVEGREHLPRRRAAILAGNHLSFSDSIFLPLVVRRRVIEVPATTTVTTTTTTSTSSSSETAATVSTPQPAPTTVVAPAATVVVPAGVRVEGPRGSITIDVRPSLPTRAKKPARVRDHRRR